MARKFGIVGPRHHHLFGGSKQPHISQVDYSIPVPQPTTTVEPQVVRELVAEARAKVEQEAREREQKAREEAEAKVREEREAREREQKAREEAEASAREERETRERAEAARERIRQLAVAGRALAPSAIVECLRTWKFEEALAFVIEHSPEQAIHINFPELSPEERDVLIQSAISCGMEIIVSLMAAGRYVPAALELSQIIMRFKTNYHTLLDSRSDFRRLSFLSFEDQTSQAFVSASQAEREAREREQKAREEAEARTISIPSLRFSSGSEPLTEGWEEIPAHQPRMARNG